MGRRRPAGAAGRRSAVLLAASAVALGSCVDTREQLRILQEYDAISATPSNGAPDFDYTVLIRNLRPVGVDPGLKADRQRLAAAYLGERCPAARIVGETDLATTNPLLGQSSRDYAVRVKC